MKMKTTLKLCISPTPDPRGVFIATREGGARLEQLAKILGLAAAATVRPRPALLGRGSVASMGRRAWRFEPRAVLSVSFQFLCPLSGFQPLVLTKSAS